MSHPTVERTAHAWLPKTTCDDTCVRGSHPDWPVRVAMRSWLRVLAVTLVLLALPVLTIPLPGRSAVQRGYCRLVLRCLGIRVNLSGNPIRNISGVLVVSNHTSWVDVFVIGSVIPGSFVARADLVSWPAVGIAARMVGIIPIERRSLRGLPPVVDTVADRLSTGRTVVAFPEGTTYCGRHRGRFRPAVFQAAIDSGRPVQPLHLAYRHRDGRPSTVTAFLGEDSLWASVKRTVAEPNTTADLTVGPLQIPGSSRRELAARCEPSIRLACGAS